MQLPNRDLAYIPPEKLTDYLLSETHMIGQAKAQFFQRLGFTSTNADLLAAQLLHIAHNADNAILSHSPYGQKYSLIGTISGPDQRIARVQTIWIIEPDDVRPRFVTAYPA